MGPGGVRAVLVDGGQRAGASSDLGWLVWGGARSVDMGGFLSPTPRLSLEGVGVWEVHSLAGNPRPGPFLMASERPITLDP